MWRVAKPIAAVNTVELDFGKHPEVKQVAVLKWIRSLGVQPTEIEGIMVVNTTSSRVIWIKLASKQIYEDFLAKNEGVIPFVFQYENNSSVLDVKVYPAGLKERRVSLWGVHLDLKLEDLREALTDFGKVRAIRRETIFDEEVEMSYQTGRVTAMMELSKHIPSTILIADKVVSVNYARQPPTCHACQQTGHIAANCENKKKPRQQNAATWANMVKGLTNERSPPVEANLTEKPAAHDTHADMESREPDMATEDQWKKTPREERRIRRQQRKAEVTEAKRLAGKSTERPTPLSNQKDSAAVAMEQQNPSQQNSLSEFLGKISQTASLFTLDTQPESNDTQGADKEPSAQTEEHLLPMDSNSTSQKRPLEQSGQTPPPSTPKKQLASLEESDAETETRIDE